MSKNIQSILFALLILASSTTQVNAQAEYMAWGNLIGIRVDGQLMEFESGLAVVSGNFEHVEKTAKERQKPKYMRNGNTQTVQTAFSNFDFKKAIADAGEGKVDIDISAKAKLVDKTQSAWFFIELPEKHYANGKIEYGAAKTINLNSTSPQHISAHVFEIKGEQRSLKIESKKPLNATLINKNNGTTVYIELLPQNSSEGNQTNKNLKITASGSIDNKPVNITIDSDNFWAWVAISDCKTPLPTHWLFSIASTVCA